MRLIDILGLLSDSVEVFIYGNDGELIATYDGKNSIETCHNHLIIDCIYPIASNQLNIFLRDL